jgi:hypothetical protein
MQARFDESFAGLNAAGDTLAQMTLGLEGNEGRGRLVFVALLEGGLYRAKLFRFHGTTPSLRL